MSTVMVFAMFGRDEKDVILDFSADSGVAPDDVGQCRGFQFSYLIVRKNIGVEEPVTIPQSFKLFDQNRIDEFSDHRTWSMVFREPS